MADDFKLKLVITADGKRAKSEIKEVEGTVNRLGRTAGRAFASFAGNVAANAVSSLTGLLVDGGKAVFDFSNRLDQTEKSFENFTQSAELAKKEVQDLLTFASDKPFDFTNFTNLSLRLRDVTKDASDIPGIMTDIGNAVAATGEITDERFSGVGVAISQILSKGKVSAEEFEQLAERNINAWGILSKELKVPQAELRKLAEQGKISSDLFLKVFQNFSRQNFGDAMEKQSRTFGGATKRIKNHLLVTARESFKPLYEAATKFTSNFADALDKNEPKLRSTAFSLGEAIGRSFQEGISKGSGKNVGVPIVNNSIAGVLATYIPDLVAGTIEGATTPRATNFVGQLNKIKERVAAIATEANKYPDIAKLLNAKDAEKEAKSYAGVITDLVNQIEFLGQNTEVAATKQKLLGIGFTNFLGTDAQNAIGLAKTLDRLKKVNDITESLKDFQRGVADSFATTELEKFELWVSRNALGFRELNSEIEATRSLLKLNELSQNFKAQVEAIDSVIDIQTRLRADIDRSIRGLLPTSSNPFIEQMTRFAETMLEAENIRITAVAGLQGVADTETIQFFPDDFAQQTQGYVNTIENLKSVTDDATPVIKKFSEYLQNLGQIEILDKDGNIKYSGRIFGEKGADRFIRKLLQLNQVVNQNELTKGLEKLDDIFESLGLRIGGLGKQTELEKLNKLLADPQTTKAIEDRAKALGMTAEELKNLTRATLAHNQTHDTQGQGGVFDPDKQPGGVFQEQLDIATGKIRNFEDVLQGLGSMATDVFMQIGEGLGSMVESWVLLGDAADVSFKKMVATVLAGVAAQSTTLAIFHTAMGIAALTPWGAAVYGPAPLHFKAAALWGAIAVGTALAGRAVAGNSFSSGSGSGGSGSVSGSTSAEPSTIIANSDFERPGIKDQLNEIARIGASVAALASAVSGLDKKISSSSPGDVLTAGMREKDGFVTDRIIADLKKNSTKTTDFGKALRLK